MLAMRRIRLRLSRSTVLLSTVLVTFFLIVYLSDSGRGTRHPTSQTSKRSPRGVVDELDDYDDDRQHTFKWNIFKPDPIIAKGLTYSADGLVHGWDKIHAALVRSKSATADKHPIRELMKDGRKRYDSMLKRLVLVIGQARVRAHAQTLTTAQAIQNAHPSGGGVQEAVWAPTAARL